MDIPEKDISILRHLGEEQARIASLPVHKETIAEWKRLNRNQPGRPLVWINEVPWHEMDVGGELEPRTTHPFSRQVEETLRKTIYQWHHFPCDMVVEPKFYSPLVIHDPGFGIAEDVKIAITDESSDIVSRDYHPQIDSERDLDKIKTPVVTHDEEASEENFNSLVAILGGILSVEKIGIVHRWFAPWDELVQWWGIQKALMDLVLRPELVHQAMERLTDAHLSRLQQWNDLNLLSLTDGNYRVGSGGLGYTGELPKEGVDSAPVRTVDQWGCATAQVFSAVSPDMHEEFALRYERRWLEQFGLNYYGCCEPLHDKVEVLESLPNLRKISMSPWADVEMMVQKTSGRYILSYKPTPAVFIGEKWNPVRAREDLTTVLEKTEGCVVEIIMKDISTVGYEPQRLWEWAELAMEIVQAVR